jgi:hypothetical protein
LQNLLGGKIPLPWGNFLQRSSEEKSLMEKPPKDRFDFFFDVARPKAADC